MNCEERQAHTDKRWGELRRIMEDITGEDAGRDNWQRNKAVMRYMICLRMEAEGHSRYRVARACGRAECTMSLGVLDLKAKLHQPDLYPAHCALWREFIRRVNNAGRWRKAEARRDLQKKMRKRREYY